MSRSAGPIGVFDSGIGGLSVARQIRRLLPHEDLVYFADTAHCPYGPRPPDEIRHLAAAATGRLLERGAKLVVVACNTASTAALATLRATFPVPFVGIVPAVKPATQVTRTGRVGVIATAATVQAEMFAELVAQFASGVEVLTRACPGLVELVEQGAVDSPETTRLLGSYLEPMVAAGIDTLVLGCTHYPFLRPAIERIVGPEVLVLDTGLPVARQVHRVLEARGLLATTDRPGRIEFLSSGDLDQLQEVARRLLREVHR